MTLSSPPTISVIVPLFNVEAYLPDLLRSFDAQRSGLDRLEFVFVDDGSADGSGTIAQEWLDRSRATGRVLVQENGGAAAARNRALEMISGAWVTFPDSDDFLSEDYFELVLGLIDGDGAEQIHLISTNILMFEEATGTVADTHALRFKFQYGARTISLAQAPHCVQLSAPTSVLRTGVVLDRGLRFDPRVKPTFEDAKFIAAYLLTFEDPTLTIVPNAKYYYRRRADASSLVTSSHSLPAKYTDVLEFGHLSIMDEAQALRGGVPEWLQNTILYDVQWSLVLDKRLAAPTKLLDPEVKQRFLSLLRLILQRIDTDVIWRYRVSGLAHKHRLALLAIKDEHLDIPQLTISKLDPDRRLMLIRYAYAGSAPVERFVSAALDIVPRYAKSRVVKYFDEVVMHERILWVHASRDFVAWLDGRPVELALGLPRPRRFALSEWDVWRHYAPGCRRPSDVFVPGPLPDFVRREPHGTDAAGEHRRRRVLRGARRGVNALLRSARRLFSAGERTPVKVDPATLHRPGTTSSMELPVWLFVDRGNQAGDNAEHLYRHVRTHRSDVEAWYVLEDSSPDWRRLRREGFQLVHPRSPAHRALVARTRNVISSHADGFVIDQWGTRKPPVRSKFVFLQHGVTKDDLSRWINEKPIDLITTTSDREQASFVGDETAYTFTSKEVVLTGFARHDALLRKHRAVSAEAKRVLLIAPTWRNGLLAPGSNDKGPRALARPLVETEYWRNWLAVLQSELLGSVAKVAGIDVVFLPHPNMETHLDADAIARAGVRLVRYSDGDVQQLLAHTDLLVTDYSSLAFDLAYIGGATVYFQFDRSEFFAGQVYERGYFDYATDGFGPVTETPEETLAAVTSMLQGTSPKSGEFVERIVQAFRFVDEANCERIVEAIDALHVPEPLTIS